MNKIKKRILLWWYDFTGRWGAYWLLDSGNEEWFQETAKKRKDYFKKLEKRAFASYVIANFGLGILVTIVLSPILFPNTFVWFLVTSLSALEFALVFKMDYDAYKLGLVEGFKKNSGWESHSLVMNRKEEKRK